MIADKFRDALDKHPDRPFIVTSSGAWTYAEFYAYTRQLVANLDQLPAGRIAAHLPDSPQLIALIFAAGISGRSLVLFNHDYAPQKVAPLLDRTDAVVLITDNPAIAHPNCQILPATILDKGADSSALNPPAIDDGEILILTSGTTGEPKCAQYNWQNLFAQVKLNPTAKEERWLLAYRLNHFAGIQMLAHALSNGSTLVLAQSNQVADAIAAIIKHGVTHVSSTPTFWRFALTQLQDNRHNLPLQHITLGSEAASADLLDKLHGLFPEARIVQIYASTEAGSCISVSDMQPGLPATVLNRPADAEIQFRIIDDELQIKTAKGMRSYLGTEPDNRSDNSGWLASGDLVRLENDRIMFVGRKNETINVGGVKVHPLDVENIISPVAGVKLVKVYGQANPIVGQIVAIDVVCDAGHPPDEVEARIRSACSDLPPASQPRSINFVDTILTNNYKLSRH